MDRGGQALARGAGFLRWSTQLHAWSWYTALLSSCESSTGGCYMAPMPLLSAMDALCDAPSAIRQSSDPTDPLPPHHDSASPPSRNARLGIHGPRAAVRGAAPDARPNTDAPSAQASRSPGWSSTCGGLKSRRPWNLLAPAWPARPLLKARKSLRFPPVRSPSRQALARWQSMSPFLPVARRACVQSGLRPGDRIIVTVRRGRWLPRRAARPDGVVV